MSKIKLIHVFFSCDIADLGILQSDLLRAFWLVNQEPEF